MKPEQLELIILKPTPVFSSFLADQLSEFDSLDSVDSDIDNTAYVIKKQANDEETLSEIEKQFPLMFRHEITRRLGDEVLSDIQCSFLDFLCCFKFEMHSQMILMEPDMQHASQILRIKPRSVLLKWVKTSLLSRQSEEDMDADTDTINHLTVSHIADDATVLLKNFKQRSDIKGFMSKYYRAILKAEMFRLFESPSHWLDVDSYKAFSRYFTVDYHSQLVHLY